MLALYCHRESVIHRWPAGVKLAGLCVVSVVLLATDGLAPPLLAIFACLGVIALAGLPARAVLAGLRPLVWVAAVIAIAHAAFSSPMAGVIVVARLVALVGLATVLTLTTPLSAMLETLTRLASPLRIVGARPEAIALAMALVVRFVPLLMADYAEIQAARAARGARGWGVLALGPLLVKTLARAAELGQAIDARGFGRNSR